MRGRLESRTASVAGGLQNKASQRQQPSAAGQTQTKEAYQAPRPVGGKGRLTEVQGVLAEATERSEITEAAEISEAPILPTPKPKPGICGGVLARRTPPAAQGRVY